MDDDLTFGASVWGSTDATVDMAPGRPAILLSTATPPPPAPDSDFGDSAFDDFEDFNTAPTSAVEANDEFGDFEEFGEEVMTSDDQGFISGPSSRDWHALRLDPLPERSELEAEIQDLLDPIWADEDISQVTTDEGIREVEGVAQILTTPESREMYKTLLQTPPPIKPPNWTRSRIRRQHLIALGIPVNLDEMLPRANSKPLPPLEINTRPHSIPGSARNSMSAHPSRSSTPQPVGRKTPATAQFGPKPDLDMDKINTLLALDTETLNIQPLSALEGYLTDFKLQTVNTSNLLTYLLQTRDALQQDSETYNGLIAEMVGEAQKMKTGKQRTGSIRRSGVA